MSQGYASAGLASEAIWRDWTPAYTNITVGNGTVVARYKPGEVIVAHFTLTFGSSTTIAANARISTPVTAASGYTIARNAVGEVMCFDSTAAIVYGGLVGLETTTEFKPRVLEIVTTYAQHAQLTDLIPFTWAVDDILAFSAEYEPV